jgi:lipopolysaccharide export system ATP-binding protein
MSKLSTRNLVKRYSNRVVVDHVSLELEQGQIVGLLGPNGAGKTTTFHMVVGLIQADEGEIKIDDEHITQLPMYQRARRGRGIGYLSQEPSIFRKLTVEENIKAVLEMNSYTPKQRQDMLEKLMADLGISHLAKQKAYQLSGGERRRTEIARALATEPAFMLLDEPFAGIDPIAVQDLQQIILQLKNLGLGVLVTDHNVEETLGIVDMAYLIADGKILMSGTPEEWVKSEIARQRYLGERFELYNIERI